MRTVSLESHPQQSCTDHSQMKQRFIIARTDKFVSNSGKYSTSRRAIF